MEFRLLAPNKFILDWVKEKFLHRIKELVHDFFSLEQKQAPQVISVKVSVGKQTGFQTYAARNNVSRDDENVQNRKGKPNGWLFTYSDSNAGVYCLILGIDRKC